MATSVATAAFPTYFEIGDGGVGAGVQASKIIGTSNQALKVLARTAGAAGNTKTFGIVVSGVSTVYSQVITSSSVLINSATDGSSLATTTVLQAIEKLFESTTFADNFQANPSAGNGSGVLVAGASAVLTSGADGAEVFSTVSEVRNITGPQRQASLIEVTNMDSPNSYREYITSFLDAGAITFEMNFTNVASQLSVISALENRTKRNCKLVFTTAAGTVTYSFAGFFIKFENNFQMNQQLVASVELKITGGVTVS